MSANCLKGNRGTLEYRLWSRWMRNLSKLVDRHIAVATDDDPLAYNETASVSVLTAAAALSGFVALAEFSTRKSIARDGDANVLGRSDLWLFAERRSWAFEFKQFKCESTPRTSGSRLHSRMQSALNCAGYVGRDEADRRVAGVICPLYWIDPAIASDAMARIHEFIESECDFAWAITHPAEGHPTFLMFKLL